MKCASCGLEGRCVCSGACVLGPEEKRKYLAANRAELRSSQSFAEQYRETRRKLVEAELRCPATTVEKLEAGVTKKELGFEPADLPPGESISVPKALFLELVMLASTQHNVLDEMGVEISEIEMFNEQGPLKRYYSRPLDILGQAGKILGWRRMDAACKGE